MDSEQSKQLAYGYLCQRIEITHYPKPPDNVYFFGYNPAREHLFNFKLLGHESVGSSEFITVDGEAGEVRYHGFHGE